MLSELTKRIQDEFMSCRYELISQISVSDDEYEELLRYVRDRVRNIYIQTIIPIDEVLSVAMVQIAIRVYSDGNYWDCFNDEVGIDTTPSQKHYFAEIFAKTIRKNKLFVIKQENNARYQYVENIKAHTFVPDKYLSNYFDFLFSFYDRNLLRQLTDDIDEDIDDLISFVSESLSGKGDTVSIEKSGDKPAKSYKLLKATRTLIAQSTTSVVCDMFFDHLVLMDNYYYDGKLPKEADRFSVAFLKWVEKKNSEINASEGISRKRKAKESFFRKPHFLIERSKKQAYIVIPSQKFRTEGYANQAKVEIRVGGETITKHLEVYKAYGVLISEEIKLPVTDLFAEYKIVISANAMQAYDIPSNQFRVFDEDFTEGRKLKKGTNYVLVKKGSVVSGNISERFVNTDYDLWDEYCYDDVAESSVIYINGKPLSMVGVYSDKPLFEYVSKEYLLYKNGNQVQTAFKHPVVSFKIDKSMLSRARLFINDDIYVVERDCIFTVFDFPEEKNIIGVSIDLNNVLSDEDAVYQIRLDEPGKLPRTIAQYVLITKLRCKSSKLRFTFSSTAEVIISGDYAIRPLNCELNELGEYVVDLLGGSEAGEFELEFSNEIYTLIVPLKVFKFGFEKQWQIMRPDYLWHSDVKNELYLSIPGATEARAYFHKDDSTYICGQMYEEGKFKIDISDFIPRITESTSAIVYINIRYLDNRWRKLSLLKVLTRTWIERFSLLYKNDEMAMFVEYQGKNPLCARFYQNDSGELISETEVINGINSLSKLSMDGLYRLEWYEMQSDEFGFDINYITRWHIFRMEAEKNMTGSAGQKRVPKNFLDNYEIALPSIEQQQSQSKALDKVMALIKLHHQQLEKLDELVKARFIELFGATSAENCTKQIKDYAEVLGGYAFKSDLFCADAIPVIRISNINNGCVELDYNICFDELFWEQNKRFRVEQNDVLMAMSGATTGKAGIYRENMPALINQRVTCIRAKDGVACPTFLFVATQLEWMYDLIQETSAGCAQPNISGKQIENMPVPDASYEQQQQFASFVEQTDKSKLAIQQSLEKLETLKKALMQEYFG